MKRDIILLDSIDAEKVDFFQGIFLGYGDLSKIIYDITNEEFFTLLCAFSEQEFGSTKKIITSDALAAYIILFNKTNVWLRFCQSSYSETPHPFFYFSSFYSIRTFLYILENNPSKLNDLFLFCSTHHDKIYFFSPISGTEFHSLHRHFTLLLKPTEQTAIFEKFIISLFGYFNLKTLELYNTSLLRDYCAYLVFISTFICSTDNGELIKSYFDFDCPKANHLIVDMIFDEYIVKQKHIIGLQYHTLFKNIFSLPQYSSYILTKHIEPFFQYCDFDENIKTNPEFFAL